MNDSGENLEIKQRLAKYHIKTISTSIISQIKSQEGNSMLSYAANNLRTLGYPNEEILFQVLRSLERRLDAHD